MRQAGYCDRCEWMPLSEVCDRLILHPNTPPKWAASGKLTRTTHLPVPLYLRASVEHQREQMIEQGKGWLGRFGGARR